MIILQVNLTSHLTLAQCLPTLSCHDMASRFNSTIFGQLLRLLSGNRLFQYSDEIDPSLWKTAIQPGTAQASLLGEGIDSAEKADSHIVGLRNDGIEHDQAILLVYWYSSDDPEVCPALPQSMRLCSHKSRIPRITP